MAGGKVETDPVVLAEHCERFMEGTKKLYDNAPNEGDMWFFELYHHLNDCAAALRKRATPHQPTEPMAPQAAVFEKAIWKAGA